MTHMAHVRIIKTYVLDVFVNLDDADLPSDANDEEIEDVANEMTWNVKWPDGVEPDDASLDYAEIEDRWEA